MGLIIWSDAHALVADRDDDVVLRAHPRDAHLAALGRVFHRVGDQVADHLCNTGFIGLHQRQVGRHVDDDVMPHVLILKLAGDADNQLIDIELDQG